jgi:hypothetical protein
MASERSIYNKIFVVLEIANSYESEKFEDLKEYIKDISPNIFKTNQYNEKIDDFAIAFSEKVLDRIFAICKALELLDNEFRITELGRKASDLLNFNSILSNQVYSIFQKEGIKLDEINEIIKNCFKAEPPILPTARKLWEIANIDMPLIRFSQYINLLYHCNLALVSQKKIYLSFTTFED